MSDGRYVDGSIYFYAPNKGAPVFFAVAFAVSGICHIYQCFHYQSWRLTTFYVTCAVLFTAGFIVRELGAFDYGDLVKFIVTTCLVYAAPPIAELANYNILGRILYYVPYHSPIHPGRVITTFAFISTVVEALNGNGASLSANQSLPRWKQELGRNLLKAALLIQLVVIAFFLLLAGTFHRRCRRGGIRSAKLENVLYTLYASTSLLTIRTIYRVVEYWSVADLHYDDKSLDPMSLSPIIRYEWFFYVFEASLMLVNHVLMNVRHPRRYLPKSTKTYLSARDGKTEVTGPGYKDSRPFLLTLVDPFNLGGLIRGKGDGNVKFWEEEDGGHEADKLESQKVKAKDYVNGDVEAAR
ncbi:RTA1 domain-containing protein [Neurospora crassa OR74A]|uniref:RTA1 domain-containing protein n=1 Tax=Neurospora crassa (strain ATCC 24698 / 74-OR23-1A / CBS 708.71 / DSM 1257 / FGSC 987) TaxID=367110 RepID=Q7S4W3_NEUCR|nr:RTA1 domain-containing protein [Neurospora crassa OR74A]EAA30548.2 RTA1 domain-containing protein [Neurospora crassa OR74A]|eukprot:XP_959784.2 RTA1 domain-containing protein [Neurospora crassa OR74A]